LRLSFFPLIEMANWQKFVCAVRAIAEYLYGDLSHSLISVMQTTEFVLASVSVLYQRWY
jgi:hypothetical protein